MSIALTVYRVDFGRFNALPGCRDSALLEQLLPGVPTVDDLGPDDDDPADAVTPRAALAALVNVGALAESERAAGLYILGPLYAAFGTLIDCVPHAFLDHSWRTLEAAKLRRTVRLFDFNRCAPPPLDVVYDPLGAASPAFGYMTVQEVRNAQEQIDALELVGRDPQQVETLKKISSWLASARKAEQGLAMEMS